MLALCACCSVHREACIVCGSSLIASQRRTPQCTVCLLALVYLETGFCSRRRVCAPGCGCCTSTLPASSSALPVCHVTSASAVAVGGVMAYQKKGSRASLLASAGIAAALLLGAALMTGRTRVAGTLLALGARPHDMRMQWLSGRCWRRRWQHFTCFGCRGARPREMSMHLVGEGYWRRQLQPKILS